MSNDTLENENSTNDGVNGTTENLDDQDIIQPSANDDTGNQDTDDELREKLDRAQEQNQRLFERAKKAEGFEKQPDGSWVKVQKKVQTQQQPTSNSNSNDGDLSTKDVMALMGAQVTEDDDIEIVKKYAKLNGLDVRTALKEDVVKSILANNNEKRRTASATNTGKSRTGPDKKSGAALHERAKKTGELPDSDEDMIKLAEEALDAELR